MDRKIFLIRHGQIDCGGDRRYIGITDLPLSAAGIEQVTRLKECFSDVEMERVFTSPLTRCRQTAAILLKGTDTEAMVIDELKEINMGDWENQAIDYIKDRFPEMYEKRGANIDTFVPPGGESFAQLQKRVMPALEKIIVHTAGNVLIISHAGVNRVILSQLLDFPLQHIFKISQPYGCINQLSWNKALQRWEWEFRECL